MPFCIHTISTLLEVLPFPTHLWKFKPHYVGTQNSEKGSEAEMRPGLGQGAGIVPRWIKCHVLPTVGISPGRPVYGQ